MRHVQLITFIVLAAFGAASARAGDVHVDAATGDDARDGSTWAAAVRSIGRGIVLAQARAGADTVHVAAGTYAENVLVSRGDITLLGGYPSGGGARNASANPTVVDGAGRAPALTISGGAGRLVLPQITVDGFTFRNGAALGRAGILGGGGGVFMEEAEALVTNNVIESNVIRGNGFLGAGLYAYRDVAGPARIERNVFRDNRAENGSGGAVALVDFADPSLGRTSFASNEVRDNRAVSLPTGQPALALAQGGGLFLWGGFPIVSSNTITGNVAESQLDADYSGQGGGLFALDSAPHVTNNTIEDNVARSSRGQYGGAGGAVYAWWSNADASGGDLLAESNVVSGNRAEGDSGWDQGTGGGFALGVLAGAAPVLRGNTISGNVATGLGPAAGIGGGVFAYVQAGSGGTVRIEGGTLDGNAALDGGGGAWLQGGAARAIVMDGVLVDSNEADFGSGVMVYGDAELRDSRIRRNRVHDPDGDQVSEIQDNCRGLANAVQADADDDGEGDACDDDDDADGVLNLTDNCPLVSNPAQGPACTNDADGDGVPDTSDNCRFVANATQSDATLDGVGDACEPAAFDALETNASGVWVTGDARLTNLEVTDNVGQGLLLIGTAADPPRGIVEDPASVAITNLTIADNDAAGFVTYLADGSSFRDTIIARNSLSDGFDTERVGGGPSSPDIDCDHVYYFDGIGSLPCNGSNNLDFTDGLPLFEAGLHGDYYLAQVAAGSPQDFVGVDAGSRSAASSPVATLTTRIDAAADSGTVDLGHHYDTPPPPVDDALAGSIRAAVVSGRVEVSSLGAPGVTTVRWYRGRIDQLRLRQYSHSSPFTGLAGDPECSMPAAVPLSDPAALTDGQDWYYLAVDVTSGSEGTFGRDSQGNLRPRPETSPTDQVTNACP